MKRTIFRFLIPGNGNVSVQAVDLMGRIIDRWAGYLQKGQHIMHLQPGQESIVLLIVSWNSQRKTIKVIQSALNASGVFQMKYGGGISQGHEKVLSQGSQPFSYSSGDELLLIGYSNAMESGILSKPSSSQTIAFQFAANIPCIGVPTVTYGGKVYHAIQVFSQCWLKENLNVGSFISSWTYQHHNGIIEKYCLNNDEYYCDWFGGLYLWDEAMQYASTPGAQGICPLGWHIPTDMEWKILEGAIDSQIGIGDTAWDKSFYRGTDAGHKLKDTLNWYGGGIGSDAVGLSFLASGYKDVFSIVFGYQGYASFHWTSTSIDLERAWARMIYFQFPRINRQTGNSPTSYRYKDYGMAVRCIKD